jgi:hypothetical protein
VTEQLALIPAGPKLGDRQHFVLELVERAGTDGVSADEAGAAWCAERGKHPVEERCEFDGKTGNDVLRSLRAKGLVRYRKRTPDREGGWVAVDASEPPPAPSGSVPYNEFPEGF